MWSLAEIKEKSDFPTIQALRMKLRRCGVEPSGWRRGRGAPQALYSVEDLRWALKERFQG